MNYILVFFLLVNICVKAEDRSDVDKNGAALKQRMAEFENGHITLDQLTTNSAWNDELLDYYKNNQDKVPVKWKLPVSRCLAGSGEYPEASKVATEYVAVYSNDWHGWRILGGAKLMQESNKDAIDAYLRAVELGDEYSYKPLGMAALAVGRRDILQNVVVPHLLKLKDDERTSKNDRLDMIAVLVGYSLQVGQEKIFVEALSGLDPSDISNREDLKGMLNEARKQFKSEEAEKIFQRMGHSP